MVQQETDLFNEVYDRVGRPLERDHWGEFLAVAPDGRTIVGSSLRQVAIQAWEPFGSGVFLYRIGERAVGRWL